MELTIISSSAICVVLRSRKLISLSSRECSFHARQAETATRLFQHPIMSEVSKHTQCQKFDFCRNSTARLGQGGWEATAEYPGLDSGAPIIALRRSGHYSGFAVSSLCRPIAVHKTNHPNRLHLRCHEPVSPACCIADVSYT
jgi:hypothetical protein